MDRQEPGTDWWACNHLGERFLPLREATEALTALGAYLTAMELLVGQPDRVKRGKMTDTVKWCFAQHARAAEALRRLSTNEDEQSRASYPSTPLWEAILGLETLGSLLAVIDLRVRKPGWIDTSALIGTLETCLAQKQRAASAMRQLRRDSHDR